MDRIMGRRAPHRFRPFKAGMGPSMVLPGTTQLAGHSSPELFSRAWTAADLAAAGLRIVDPCYHVRRGTGGYRYGVIHEGGAWVVDESSEGRGVPGRNS